MEKRCKDGVDFGNAGGLLERGKGHMGLVVMASKWKQSAERAFPHPCSGPWWRRGTVGS